MSGVCLLLMCLLAMREDIVAMLGVPSNDVASSTPWTAPLEDLVVAVDEGTVARLSHLRLDVSLDLRHLDVHPHFSSSVVSFALTRDGSARVLGVYRLQRGSSFLTKGALDVSLTGLEVTGAADLVLGESCVSAHGRDTICRFRGRRASFILEMEDGVAVTENVTTAIFLASFQELVREQVTQVVEHKVLMALNSFLCSMSVEELLGGEDAEMSYRKSGLVPVPHFNDIVDTILENLKPVIIMQGLDVIHLPDVNTSFAIKESIFKLRGMLLAENGTFANLTSVRRTGDCMLAGNGTFFLASGEIGMDALNISYDDVRATFEDVEFAGKISIAFDIVSVRFRAIMTVFNSTCYPILSRIHVNKLDKIHVKVEGHRAWIIKDIILVAFERYKNKIVAYVDSLLQKLADENLKSFDCRNIFGVTK